MKKPLLAILWLLLALLLPACAPHMTYDELIDAERIETDPEAKQKLTERIDKFESDGAKAQQFYELRFTCTQSSERAWVCTGSERFNDKRPPETLDKRVSAYRNDRHICGCIDRKKLFF